MCSFDPGFTQGTIVPNLSHESRLSYVSAELETLRDLLDCAEDCKWVYQALLQYTSLEHRLTGETPATSKRQMMDWLKELQKLDPLRKGRWNDLTRTLNL